MFLAIHGGAGIHSKESEGPLKELLKRVSMEGMKMLLNNSKAEDVIVSVISLLEDDPLVNAGFGSALNIDGEVECEASVMNGNDSLFGCVANIKGIKNPIKVAFSLLEEQRIPSKLVKPIFLTGTGAERYAKEKGILCSSNLISFKASQRYEEHLLMLEQPITDTVGAVVIDFEGNYASGVSSGGITLKHSGRVGDSAIPGSGFWATPDFACSTSGIGEQLIRSDFARSLYRHLQSDSSPSSLDTFIKQFSSKTIGIPSVGFISIYEDLFLMSHTTPSMAIGYINSSMEGKYFISRRSTDIKTFSTTIKSK